ncbi:hypothetical protein B5X24_HaOG206319 [Helicoverpa armigera]|nr:hypothetical protein B5X24_HaOG206319 [Helicoverpa armigera]
MRPKSILRQYVLSSTFILAWSVTNRICKTACVSILKNLFKLLVVTFPNNNMINISSLVITLVVLGSVITENIKFDFNNTSKEFNEDYAESKVLSRRKRFIIFPDGSSLQLVFLIQTPVLIPIGDIFLFGDSAGLAWLLPTDPNIFYALKEYERPLRRSDVVKTINYLDEKGRLIAKVPYERRLKVSPVIAKRSLKDNKKKSKPKIDRRKMHEKHLKKEQLKAHQLDKSSLEFHRSKRVELYQKIEKLLSTMGRDGRQCVLYKLCESAQRASKQGTFLQEFLRAVFTLPKGKEFHHDHHKEYDNAHVETDDCVTRYPGCEDMHESILL